jgi:16S rRNA (guanine527-N7)-methyltransferase
VELLTAWQKVHRLVGSTKPEWIVHELLLDSLQFLRAIPDTAAKVMDLGAGAGIPGVPMKIVRPSLRLTMLEARARRSSFLRAVVRELGLSNATVLGMRAELAVESHAGEFDAVVMRCVSPVDRALDLARAFVHEGGAVVLAASEYTTAPAGSELVRVGDQASARWFIVWTRGRGGSPQRDVPRGTSPAPQRGRQSPV